jgi:hypothetical protein
MTETKKITAVATEDLNADTRAASLSGAGHWQCRHISSGSGDT